MTQKSEPARRDGADRSTVILWFRRDLRIHANPALRAAADYATRHHVRVVPLFVIDPVLAGPRRSNRLAFLFVALQALRDSDVPLVIRYGHSEEAIAAAVEEFDAKAVVSASDFTPLGRDRDNRVETRMSVLGVEWIQSGSPYLVQPGTVRKGDGTPFKVFTPFRRTWETHLESAMAIYASGGSLEDSLTSPAKAAKTAKSVKSVKWWVPEPGSSLGDIPPKPEDRASSLPVASESAANDRLHHFVENHLRTYDSDRNDPAADATSRLSADLKFGLLHPAQVLPMLDGGGKGAEVFRSELGWREFYADVLWHHPASAHRSYNPAMEAIEVDTGDRADERFDAWCHGRTGFPFVDAGMRQLLAEGWMHNRMRMVTASFLVKDLHIDWRRGAAWFMEQLIDADVASNQHGWQWTAGTGTDAAPYYRVFNPISQGQKFDPTGAYIRRYVPELAGLSDKDVHEPWNAAGGGLFAQAPDYPTPIVDHAEERREALDRLAALKR